MTPRDEPTPETDAKEFEVTQYNSIGRGIKLKVVQSHETRTLERDRNRLREQLAGVVEQADKDSERLDELQRRFLALDTDWGERKETVLIIRWDNTPVSNSLRETIDAARAKD